MNDEEKSCKYCVYWSPYYLTDAQAECDLWGQETGCDLVCIDFEVIASLDEEEVITDEN